MEEGRDPAAASVLRRQRIAAYTTGGFGLSVSSIAQFLVPLRAVELDVPVAAIGLLLGARSLVEAVLSVPLGGLIDRVGARRAYLLGTAISTLTGLGFALSSSWVSLLASQLALGVARPLGWVGGQTYVSAMASADRQARDAGRFSFVATAAQIAVPVLVGATAQVAGVQQAFLLMALHGLLFLGLGPMLPDLDRLPGGGSQQWGRYRDAFGLLRVPAMRVAMLLTLSRLWLASVWSSFLPLVLITGGMAPGLAGSVLSVAALTATATSLLTSRLARLGRPPSLVALALGVGSLGLAVSPFLTSVSLSYLPAALVGFGQGVSLPLLIIMVSNAAPAAQRGLALGLRAGVNQLSATIAPTAVAPLIAAAGAGAFPISAVISGGVLTLATILDRRRDPAR